MWQNNFKACAYLTRFFSAEGKPLCDANGIRGYPSLKYGDPAALEDYQGGRDLDSLTKFAETALKPMCSPNNLELCNDAKKAEIQKFIDMADADLDKLISEKESEMEAAETLFRDEVQKLQETYQKLSTDKDASLEKIKASGLGLMKAVKASKKSSGVKDEL